MQFELIFSSLNISTKNIHLVHFAETTEGLSVTFEVVLFEESESLPTTFIDYFNDEILPNGFAGYSVLSDGLSGIIGIIPTGDNNYR